MFKAGYTEIHKDLYLVPIEIGSVVRLNKIISQVISFIVVNVYIRTFAYQKLNYFR